MFCSNCGAKIQDGSKFCSSCGVSTETGTHEAKQEKQSKSAAKTVPAKGRKSSAGLSVGKIIAVIVGFLFLVVVMVAGMTGYYMTRENAAAGETAQNAAGESVKETKENKENKEKDDALGKNLYKEKLDSGQEVIYGVSSNVMIAPVYAKEFKGAIGTKYHEAVPQGKFIGVVIMIGNEQNDAITVNEGSFRLVDERGREYSTSTRATLSWRLRNRSQEILTKINPGNSSVFTFFFDVPADADIKKFKLQGRGGVMGEKVVIPINYLDKFKDWLE